MAFPVVAYTSTGVQGSDATTHSVTIRNAGDPAIAAGELLVIFMAFDGVPTVTWPAGWTSITGAAGVNGTAVRLEVRYRFADGTEGATISLTTSAAEQSAYRCVRITGAHPSTPPEGAAVNASSNAPNPPALNPAAWDVEDTLWYAVVGGDDGRRSANTYPTNYTNGFSDATNGISGCAIGTARRELAAASEDPGAFAWSGSVAHRAATIAIRPALDVDTTITAGPTEGSRTNATTAQFSFTSNQGGATFQVRIDGGAWTTQTSPYTTPTLADGSHTFEVRATASGTTDPTPASRTWTIDATAPATPTGLTATPGNAQVVLDWADNTEPDLQDYVVEQSTDNATWGAALGSPVVASALTVTSLTNGTLYYFRVRARDTGALNTSGPTASVSATPAAPVTTLEQRSFRIRKTDTEALNGAFV